MNKNILNEIINQTVSKTLRKELIKESVPSSVQNIDYDSQFEKIYNLAENEIKELGEEVLGTINSGRKLAKNLYTEFKEDFKDVLAEGEQSDYFNGEITYTFNTKVPNNSDELYEEMESRIRVLTSPYTKYKDRYDFFVDVDEGNFIQIEMRIDVLDMDGLSKAGKVIMELCEQYI